ncbi:uncharacterized protein LOC143243070 isoform X2 [Tachypleus tridentatus]|uniref:uncharacterized protein LOC143243070 isoform X2 n=1 Tax=Tachypleus tridentatus TaxID=6853 RepID=UPI003FD3C589
MLHVQIKIFRNYKVVLSHDTNRNKLQQAGHCLCELNHLPRFCDFECVRTLFFSHST